MRLHLTYYGSFIGQLWRLNPRWIIGRTFLTVTTQLIPIGQLVVAQRIVDLLVSATTQGVGTSTAWPQLLSLILIEMGLFLVFVSLNRIDYLTNEIFLDQLRIDSIQRILEKAAALDLAQYDDPAFYNKIKRLERDSYWRPGNLYNSLFQTLAAVTSLAATIGLFLALPAWIVILMILAILPTFYLETKHGEAVYQIDQDLTEEERQASWYSWALTDQAMINDIKLHRLEPLFIRRFRHLWGKFITRYQALNQRYVTLHLVFQFVSVVVRAGVYLWLGWVTLMRLLTIGQFTLYTGLVGQLATSVSLLLSGVARASHTVPYLKNLTEFLSLRPVVASPDRPRRLQGSHRPVPITFDHVWFRYPNDRRWVLRDVSFTIAPGDRVALVGENGAGKTTIVKLLARIYDPTKGQILLGKYPLTDYDPKDIQGQVGVILQDFGRFRESVRENVAFGDWRRRGKLNEIQKVAAQSGAASFIERLPKKYETLLTRGYTEGTELSGGQWQRIALSRLFFRTARLLILDEPTAALDAAAEEQFYRQFVKLRKSASVVLISHRFSTVRMADQILVIDRGRLIEHGSHVELMQRVGHYAKLFTLQAKRYQ